MSEAWPAKMREQVELRALEEVLDLVVADVERADDLALRDSGAHMTLESCSATTLSLLPNVRVGERVGDDDGRAVSRTWRTMLSETPPRSSVMLSRLHVARARGRAIFFSSSGDSVGPSMRRTTPLSAPVSSMTSSSIASSSSSIEPLSSASR